MPVANQYGIDLGNILSTVSDLKTAQQNRDTNSIRQDMLSNENDQQKASQQADKDFIQNPKAAVATSVAQKLNWDKLSEEEKQQKTAQMKQNINQHGLAVNSIMGIQDPIQQKDTLAKYVATLTPEEQQGVTQKYGTTPEQWQQNLPHMMNDLLVADGGVSLLEKQAEAKTANENKLSQINALYDNKNVLADKNNQTKLDIADSNNDTKTDIAKLNSSSRQAIAQSRASNPTSGGKPSVLEMKARALVDNGTANDINDGIRQVMSAQRTTNIADPVMGNKTITSKSSYGGGQKVPQNGTVIYDKSGNPYSVINGTPVRIK